MLIRLTDSFLVPALKVLTSLVHHLCVSELLTPGILQRQRARMARQQSADGLRHGNHVLVDALIPSIMVADA